MNDNIYLIAGGASLASFDFSLLKGKDIIVVNKAILDVPFAKYFLTIDYTFIDHKLNNVKKIFQQSKATKVFIANLYPNYMIEEEGRIIDMRSNYVYKLNDFDMIIKSYNNSGIGFNFNDFRSGDNSGFCALQLAICLGYKNIHLLGYDLHAEKITHYHGGYGKSIEQFNKILNKYTSNFLYTLKILKWKHNDIKLYNYSTNSPLNKIIEKKQLEDIK